MTSFSNLRTAAGRALRGKRETLAGATFLHQLEPNLLRLERELTASTWQPAPARQFVLHEPKLRTITAVPFEDRVVHHPLIGPLESVFERHLVAHTSKGSLAWQW